jgi:hypothetical protein
MTLTQECVKLLNLRALTSESLGTVAAIIVTIPTKSSNVGEFRYCCCYYHYHT